MKTILKYILLLSLFHNTLQSDWIRQNCANQMEKVRDNYNCQTDNIKGFRQYGSTQLQGVRDQYYEQVGYIIVMFYQN